MGKSYMMRYLAYPSLGLLLLGSFSNAHASPRFLPVLETPLRVEEKSREDRFSLALSASTLSPFGAPFVTHSGASELSFRYQIPTGLALEVGYNITQNWEIAVGGGYDTFETRNNVNPTGVPRFQIAKLKSFPVLLIGRYAFDADGWIPEAELGAGMSFGTINISEDFSASAISQGLNAVQVHGAFGAGFQWFDDLTLHAQVGYGFRALDSKTYTNFSNPISQKAMQGLFAKARIRYQF